MKDNKKNNIKCDVVNCIYNNLNEGDCNLDQVKISSMGRGSECSNSSSTLCQSFESSGAIITDNEYEVSSEFYPEYYEIEAKQEEY